MININIVAPENSTQLPIVEPVIEQIIIKRGRGQPKNQIMSNALANEDETPKKKPTKLKKSKSNKNK